MNDISTNPASPGKPIGAKNGIQLHIAIAIKPSPNPTHLESDDGPYMKWHMCFVSVAGKKSFIECSKNVWNQINSHRYCYEHQSNFKLRYDTVKQMVTSIDKYPKPEERAELFEVVGQEDSGKVVLLIGRDGEVSVKNSPPSVPSGTIDDIVALAQETPDIDADELLGDRFMVEMSTKKAGQRTLTIDPTTR